MTARIIEMRDVTFRWPGARGFELSVPSFDVPTGSRTLLFGGSGTGKSTLLSLIAGIVTPAAGTIRIAGTDLAQLSAARRDRFRAEHVGVIFQMFNLLPYGSVVDNVLLPLSFAPQRRARVADPVADARRLLSVLGLPDDIASEPAAELSIGQQQRVAACRALIGGPELILADEPTSALDAGSQAKFLDLLFAQLADRGTSLVMVSHDERLAPLFDTVIRLETLLARRSPAAAGERALEPAR